MVRFLMLAVMAVVGVVGHTHTVDALSSNANHFVSADNTFYVFVKGGETISASFLRSQHNEMFDTVRGDVKITVDGPEVKQQTCIAKKDVPVGEGCRFAPQTATRTGIWKITFIAPEGAKTYKEVTPSVRWGGNLFSWNIAVYGSGGEKTGRIWTERYALRQPAGDDYKDDFVSYYISEDGYIYRATEFGYNGQISTLSADSVGIRKGNSCVSAYQSTEVSDAEYSPALGACGNSYKLFFEEPAGDLPRTAVQWDGSQDWIRPNIKRPTVSELSFVSDKTQDQQSGLISFFLRNFVGQYKVKVDVEGDGSFDGQNDVTLHQQMKKLSNGLQQVRFDGTDRTGQIIPTTQKIGIRIEITRVAEIHLVAADVESRTGGLELMRLNGDNAPSSLMCWNDTKLTDLADTTLMTKTPDGSGCPDSTKGVHGWANSDGSWGNARYIDDWIYAQAKLEGNNQITYPQESESITVSTQKNWLLTAFIGGLIVIGILTGIIMLIRKRRKTSPIAQQPQPLPPQPPQVIQDDRYPRPPTQPPTV